MTDEKQYTRGHFIGIGIAIGLPMGIPLGLAVRNIALGPLIGVIIGLMAGFVMEKMYNKNPIELTKEEKARRKKMSLIGIAMGIVVFVVAVAFYTINMM